jgi:hypothetical protein
MRQYIVERYTKCAGNANRVKRLRNNGALFRSRRDDSDTHRARNIFHLPQPQFKKDLSFARRKSEVGHLLDHPIDRRKCFIFAAPIIHFRR